MNLRVDYISQKTGFQQCRNFVLNEALSDYNDVKRVANIVLNKASKCIDATCIGIMCA